MDREKIGILIGEASTLFGFYGDSFDSKRAKEIIDEIYVEFLKLEEENASLKDRLTHEVEMIESAANDELIKLNEENARLRETLNQDKLCRIEDRIKWDDLEDCAEFDLLVKVGGKRAREALGLINE
jgi:predicted nuclease with TOPRIM domain